jgi:GT2 family glycosyltransferase
MHCSCEPALNPVISGKAYQVQALIERVTQTLTHPPTGFSGAPSQSFDLTAAIVTYRNPLLQLRQTIESLRQSSLRIHVVVVDNAGEAAVRELAAEMHATYLAPPTNLGFGRGHNLAYAQVRGLSPFHLVINPDVRFEQPVLETLLELMRKQQDLGVVMPRILYADGTMQFLCKRLPTPWDLLLRRFAPGVARRLLRRSMERYELRDRDYEQPMEPPSLSGCFLLLRNQVLDQTGLFDERFFMYMEDVDLVRRLRRVARALYYPAVAIVHDYQKGSYRDRRLAGHHLLSAARYFGKWGWFRDDERARLNKLS